jgi:hypothetical protein
MGRVAVTVLGLGTAAIGSAACGSAGTADATASTRAATALITLEATLSGSAEARHGDPDGKGTASISLNATKGKACWVLSVENIAKPLSAHIHVGAKGKDGPVIIPLGAKYVKQGCVIAPKKSIRAVANNPGGYYVNVHTRKHLNGAVRGQLRKGAS